MAIVYLCVGLAVVCFVLFVLTVDSLVTSFFCNTFAVFRLCIVKQSCSSNGSSKATT